LGEYAAGFLQQLLEDKRIIIKGPVADTAITRR